MDRTFVIAEAGSTHDGDMSKAVQLIQAAKECGADACKFQYISSPKRLVERRNAHDYLEIYRKYALSEGNIEFLAETCEHVGIEFMATVYLPEDIDAIAPFVKRFKIASFEANDKEFVRNHFKYDKEIIRSCGMASTTIGVGNIKNLYCVSGYPTPIDQLNLSKLHDYLPVPGSGKRDLVYDGLSDHTTSTLTGALTVAAGAKIIEKHICLWETDSNNPDRPHSLYVHPRGPESQGVKGSPFKQYVDFIRLAEKAMGTGEKGVMECEKEMVKYKVKEQPSSEFESEMN
jgi:N-acetylneuraminate synthase